MILHYLKCWIFFLILALIQPVLAADNLPDNKDKRVKIVLGKEASVRLKRKMVSFLGIVAQMSAGVLTLDFKLLEAESRKLSHLTKRNRKTKKSDTFSALKANLSASAEALYESVRIKDIDAFQKNYSRTLAACVACHSTYTAKVLK